MAGKQGNIRRNIEIFKWFYKGFLVWPELAPVVPGIGNEVVFWLWKLELTRIDWDRGKQYVFVFPGLPVFLEVKPGKHARSRIHKTYCFPGVPINNYFIIYQVSKKTKSKFHNFCFVTRRFYIHRWIKVMSTARISSFSCNTLSSNEIVKTELGHLAWYTIKPVV
jgi:hypothetical protein